MTKTPRKRRSKFLRATTQTVSAVRHRLDAESERISLYVRLASILRGRIDTGEWEVGQRIPSIAELCQEYDVARNTVRQALEVLRADGLIESGRGRGTFVLKLSRRRMVDQGPMGAISDPLELGTDQVMEILKRDANVTIPDDLRRGQPVFRDYIRVRKRHLFRNQPFLVMDIYIATPIYNRFPKGRDSAVKIARLLRDCRIKVAASRLEITTRHPDHETARLLEYSMTGSLISMRRWRTDPKGRIVTAGIHLYRGDMFLLDIAEPFAGVGPSRTDYVPRVQKRKRPA